MFLSYRKIKSYFRSCFAVFNLLIYLSVRVFEQHSRLINSDRVSNRITGIHDKQNS